MITSRRSRVGSAGSSRMPAPGWSVGPSPPDQFAGIRVCGLDPCLRGVVFGQPAIGRRQGGVSEALRAVGVRLVVRRGDRRTTGRWGSTCAGTSGRRAPSRSTGRRGCRARRRRLRCRNPASLASRRPRHFSIASTVGPLVLAVVMVALTNDIRLRPVLPAQPVHRRRHVVGVQAPVHQARRRRNTTQVQRRSRPVARGCRARRVSSSGAAPGPQSRPGRGASPRRAAEHAAVGAPAEHDDFLSLYAGLGDVAGSRRRRRPAGSRRRRWPRRSRPRGCAARRSRRAVDGGVVGIAGERARDTRGRAQPRLPGRRPPRPGRPDDRGVRR